MSSFGISLNRFEDLIALKGNSLSLEAIRDIMASLLDSVVKRFSPSMEVRFARNKKIERTI